MIGNDIVDRRAALTESNWRRPGYLQKVFNPDEQQQIALAKDPDLLVWIFWSMKEAAYKAQQRKFSLSRSFRPHTVGCNIGRKENNSVSGKVRIDNSEYFTSTMVHNSYIHTTATASAATKIFSRILPSSGKIKELTLKEISRKWDLPQSLLCIEKDCNAIPVIKLGSRSTRLPFSLSHHGNFTAFSLPLTKD